MIARVERLQRTFQASTGSRFAWLSDEWFLIAGQPLPPRASYEDLPQQENGVGSIRAFLEELEEEMGESAWEAFQEAAESE